MKNAPLAVRWRLGNPEDEVDLGKIMQNSSRVREGLYVQGVLKTGPVELTLGISLINN